MLMKWTDLLPGDVIRFTKETEMFWRAYARPWVDTWCGRDLTIISVANLEDYIELTVNMNGGTFYLTQNGNAASGFDGYRGILFEVVKLIEG